MGTARRIGGTRTHALATRVNLAKLLSLAALVPPATVGIAQRAAELSAPGTEASLVAWTSALGSLAGVVGALLLGRIADLRGASAAMRWTVVVCGGAAGLCGIALMTVAASPVLLGAGWILAQLGCSGAMAVLRALLGDALPVQRRRGATVMVALTYLGAFLPILVLIALPGSVWATAIAFAVLAVVVPAAALLRERGAASARPGASRSRGAGAPGGDEDPERAAPHAADPVRHPSDDARRLPWPLLLAVHFTAHLVLSAYLAYHSLAIAARDHAEWGDATVRFSALAIAAALLGLLGSVGALLARPRHLSRTHDLLILSGVLLSASIALRPFAGPAVLLVLLACSGAAVGLSSSALFVAALDDSPALRRGRRLGVHSALAPFGQFAGSLLGLLVVEASPDSGYRVLFVSEEPVKDGEQVAPRRRGSRDEARCC